MRTCGKTAFTSGQMAKNQARWIERQGKRLRPYRCDICHLWHLTSQVETPRFNHKRQRHG